MLFLYILYLIVIKIILILIKKYIFLIFIINNKKFYSLQKLWVLSDFDRLLQLREVAECMYISYMAINRVGMIRDTEVSRFLLKRSSAKGFLTTHLRSCAENDIFARERSCQC